MPLKLPGPWLITLRYFVLLPVSLRNIPSHPTRQVAAFLKYPVFSVFLFMPFSSKVQIFLRRNHSSSPLLSEILKRPKSFPESWASYCHSDWVPRLASDLWLTNEDQPLKSFWNQWERGAAAFVPLSSPACPLFSFNLLELPFCHLQIEERELVIFTRDPSAHSI